MKLFLPLLLVLALLGCTAPGDKSSGNAASRDPNRKLRIAVIPKGQTHEFWKSIHAGASEAAAEAGNVEIIWKGPLKEDDRDDQIKVVEDFITQKVDGIVLAPLDDSALRQPVTEAQNAGIPVLIIDSGLKDVETVSFIATDNFAAGKLGGKELIKAMGPGPKKVILLRYQEGSASTSEREAGFLDAFAESPDVLVISTSQFAGPTTESAQKASENLLAQFKEFDGVACPNESSTFGMLRALQDAGLAGKVKFVGFDASSKLVEALASAQIDGLVVQNPHKMGYEGVKQMIAHIKGGSVEKRIDTGAVVVTKANMAQPEVAKLIAAPKE